MATTRQGPDPRPAGRDQVVEAVLDAAERLFAAEGPTSVSLREIARAADVTYSLINRHFGTKEDLLDRLLERYERRWLERTGDSTSFVDAMDALLGPSPEQGAYLRLLAWSLLADERAPEHMRHATLDQLPRSDEDGVRRTAAALGLVFGWRFFQPFILEALHVPPSERQALHEHVRTIVREM